MTGRRLLQGFRAAGMPRMPDAEAVRDSTAIRLVIAPLVMADPDVSDAKVWQVVDAFQKLDVPTPIMDGPTGTYLEGGSYDAHMAQWELLEDHEKVAINDRIFGLVDEAQVRGIADVPVDPFEALLRMLRQEPQD